MYQDSILHFLPDDELEFFRLFRMEADLHVTINSKTTKYRISIFRWDGLLGFTIYCKGYNVHIVAKEYTDTLVQFKLWKTDDNMKIGGTVDDKGNFVELFKEYDDGEIRPLRRTDDDFSTLKIISVVSTMQLFDIFRMFRNIRKGARVSYGVVGDVPTNIFMIKLRDNITLKDRLNYFLYYEDTMKLVGIERRYLRGSTLTLKILQRSKYVTNYDVKILEEMNKIY